MQRYFLEIAYKGTNYSGFQVQQNAKTIQSELEKALLVLFRQSFDLTGSSRTDAGVHARQNFFHFDSNVQISNNHLYNLNAILPSDIAINGIYPVSSNAHSRFDAISRRYKYFIYNKKNPFLKDIAWYYPYKLDFKLLIEAAEMLKSITDFSAFSKKKTQVKTFDCKIVESVWKYENECLVYTVSANRFLRGMVRALVATMLKVARKNITMQQFSCIIERKNNSAADFSAPAAGLFLVSVNYPAGLLMSNNTME